MNVIGFNYKKMADKPLCEIYQSVKLRYAFVSPNDEQVAPFCLCKDFLHDMVRAFLRGEDMHIHGMSYTYGKNPPIDMGRTRILARYDNVLKVDGIDEQMESAIKLINYYDDILGVEHSKVERLSDSKFDHCSVWLFSSDKVWMSSPVLISLYTMLMRLGEKRLKFTDKESLYKAIDDVCKKKTDNDTEYISQIKHRLETALSNISFLKEGEEIDPIYYNKNIPLGTFHNNCGIVGLLSDCGTYSLAAVRTKFLKHIEDHKEDKVKEAEKEFVKEIIGEAKTKAKPKPKTKAKPKVEKAPEFIPVPFDEEPDDDDITAIIPPEEPTVVTGTEQIKKTMPITDEIAKDWWGEPQKYQATTFPKKKKAVAKKKPVKKLVAKKVGTTPLKKLSKAKEREKTLKDILKILNVLYKKKDKEIFGAKHAKKINDWM